MLIMALAGAVRPEVNLRKFLHQGLKKMPTRSSEKKIHSAVVQAGCTG